MMMLDFAGNRGAYGKLKVGNYFWRPSIKEAEARKVHEMNRSFQTLNTLLRAAIREETPVGSGADLSTVEGLLRNLRRLQRQTRDGVRDARDLLAAQIPLLERIAIAVESIDEKTREPGGGGGPPWRR